jgi:hypothetical protein
MFGQTLSTSSLTGKYFVRHVQFTTDANNNATDARSITGAITFDGSGNYSFTCQQVIGTATAGNYTVNGTYTVNGSAVVTLANPQTLALTVNARYGTEAVIGTSTEAPTNIFDLFVAIPAPPSNAGFSNSTLSVSYNIVDFELRGASTAQVRDSVGGLQFSGNGTIAFQSPSGVLLSTAPRNLALSASKNIFLGSTPGAHDILIGLHAAGSDNLTAANFNGRYWVSGLETDSGSKSNSQVGSLTVITSDSAAIISQREHQSSVPNQFDSAIAAYYSSGAAKSGTVLISVGSGILTVGNDSTFIATDVGTNIGSNQPSGTNQFQITMGVRIPTLTGPGVFVNPQGIINAAANAPVGYPISPGEFIAVYGSGLVAQTVVATPPDQTSLGGVSVSIGGFPAPIAATSPGVFSIDLSGAGDGAITHANGTLVNSASPAGETVVVYLTGLGALKTPIMDGQAPSPQGPDSAVAQVLVQVDGVS